MLILSICDNAEVLSVLRLVKIVIDIIKIVVPVMLILSLMIEFMQTTLSSDADALKKATSLAVKRCIAAVCIFFVPTIINILINTISPDDTYKECLANATKENISLAFTQRATGLVDIAKEKMDFASYTLAKLSLSKVNDQNLRNSLEKELESVKQVIEVKKLINKVKLSLSTSDYEEAAKAIETIEDDDLRSQLEEELAKISFKMASYAGEYSSDGFVENILGLPYYNQCDPRWGNIPYDAAGGGPNGGPATFCSSSCGYTSFSMIASGFNRDMSITPFTVVDHIRGPLPTHRGYGAASTSELTSASNMKFYNLTVNTISLGNAETAKSNVMKELNSGKAVIVLVPGHYIVLAPGDTSDGVTLLDPFTAWADSRKKPSKTTIDAVYQIYGGFNWAAAYSKA